MGQNTRIGVIAGLLIGLLLLLIVIGDVSFGGIAAVLVASVLTGLIVWYQMRNNVATVGSRGDEDEDEDEDYGLDESLEDRLGGLFRDDDGVAPASEPTFDAGPSAVGDSAEDASFDRLRASAFDEPGAGGADEPMFDSQTFEEPSGLREDVSTSWEGEAAPDSEPFAPSDLTGSDNGSSSALFATDEPATADDSLAAYEDEFRTDEPSYDEPSSFEDLRSPGDARSGTNLADFLPPEQPAEEPAAGFGSFQPEEPAAGFEGFQPEQPAEEPAAGFEGFQPEQPAEEPAAGFGSFQPEEPAAGFGSFQPEQPAEEPAAGFGSFQPEEPAAPLEEYRTPGAALEEPEAPSAFEAPAAEDDIFAEPGVIDENKVQSDETILGAAHASSLSATLTEEEANVETREILGRVAALLEKYE